MVEGKNLKRSFPPKPGGGGPCIGNRCVCFGLLLLALACAERLPDDPSVELRWLRNGRNPAWSPSGKYLLFNRVETEWLNVERLWMAPLEGGEARRLTSIGETGIERNGCWLPDPEKDEFLFVFESTGGCQIRSGTVGDDKTALLYQLAAPVERVAGDADRSVVVFTRGDSKGLWRFERSAVKAELMDNTQGWRDPRCPWVTPDGLEVIYVDRDENGVDNAYRIDIDGGEPTQLTSLSDGAIKDLTLSADQGLAAFIRVVPSPIQRISLVYRFAVNGPWNTEPVEIGTYHAPQSITLSPDGRYLAYDNLDNYIRIIPVGGRMEP